MIKPALFLFSLLLFAQLAVAQYQLEWEYTIENVESGWGWSSPSLGGHAYDYNQDGCDDIQFNVTRNGTQEIILVSGSDRRELCRFPGNTLSVLNLDDDDDYEMLVTAYYYNADQGNWTGSVSVYSGEDGDREWRRQIESDGHFTAYTGDYDGDGRVEFIYCTLDNGVLTAHIYGYPGGNNVDFRQPAPTPAGTRLEVFPNPFNAAARLDVKIQQDGELDIYLHDINGKRISNRSFHNLPAGFHTFTMGEIYPGLNSLPAGEYLIEARSNQSRIVQKTVRIP